MSACKLLDNFNYKNYGIDNLKQDLLDPHTNYRNAFKGTAYKLMKEYELLNLLEDSDKAEFFHDELTGSTCIVFKGTPEDLILFEDYLNNKEEDIY